MLRYALGQVQQPLSSLSRSKIDSDNYIVGVKWLMAKYMPYLHEVLLLCPTICRLAGTKSICLKFCATTKCHRELTPSNRGIEACDNTK